ncbi:MAG: helix-turn-helix transcriptional regulator, partial [Lachnospiraceae bacterium]|nr:helix-turn-helix transcriptional regulator [Lachnospiraceae bacterium]
MISDTELRSLSTRLVAEPDDYMRSFRRNISLYIDQKEITLQEVAERADISISTLKSLLYGNSDNCTLTTAVKLAKAFEVSVDELVGCGTISPQTCKSLQTMRQLPESFTHFVRWCIRFHHDNLKSHNVAKRAIEIMNPDIGGDGNLKMTNRMEFLDISELNDDVRPKIFMGIRIPSDMYAPYYFEGEVILIANDRVPKERERIVFSTSNNLWILEKRGTGANTEYISIRDGKTMAKEKDIENILGYIVK